MRRTTLLILALFTTLPAFPAPHLVQPRHIQPFDSDWRFLQSDAADAQSPTFDDSAWKPVTLPHDWAIAGPVEENAPSRAAGGFFPTGIAWYRHTLEIAKVDSTRRTFIAFDGIMANSDVYCNGELLGHRPYGYVSFNYDLTPHLHAGKNIIAVRVDNSQQPASRWYPGAGINRHVRLITTDAVHIVPWGTFISTPDVRNSDATVTVRSTIHNDSDATAEVTLAIAIDTPGNIPIRSSPGHIARVIPAHGTAYLEQSLHIANPDLWDLDHPVLYTAHVTVLSNGKPIDNEDVPFGIREFRFDPNQGFFLNGVHHKIYGVALHTDAGALGTAVPLAAWERRLTALRALGVNAIRTAHNPPAPEFLDLADRMGFLVMDEMFDCWTVAKNPYDYHLYFKEWSVRDTADTVRRDRNHPSIILWSAGNEIHDTPHPDIAIPILKSLVDTFHANDPTRPVTQALFRPNVSHDYDNGLADLLDVVGQNYREQEILKAHADKPTRKIIGTENTHDRNQWVAMRDHPEYSGQFLWSGIDYLGEAGRWPSIGAGSGLLLTTGFPRARAFERQSWWADPATAPMVRIARRVQAARRGPIDPGYASPTSSNQSATNPTPHSTPPPASANRSSSTGPRKTSPPTPKTSRSTPTLTRSSSSSTTNPLASSSVIPTPAPSPSLSPTPPARSRPSPAPTAKSSRRTNSVQRASRPSYDSLLVWPQHNSRRSPKALRRQHSRQTGTTWPTSRLPSSTRTAPSSPTAKPVSTSLPPAPAKSSPSTTEISSTTIPSRRPSASSTKAMPLRSFERPYPLAPSPSLPPPQASPRSPLLSKQHLRHCWQPNAASEQKPSRFKTSVR